jgi:hypothetical protein
VCRADRPQRLVGNHHARDSIGCNLLQGGSDLTDDDVIGRAALVVFETVPDAADRRHPGFVDGVDLLVHDLVRLAEQPSALGMADDDLRPSRNWLR